jgi:hypothetical protein
MKQVYSLLLILIFPLLGIAQSLGVAIPVADDNTYGKTRARIVTATNDIPVVMWGSKTSDKVYTARLDGNAFSTPVQITPGDMEGFVSDWAGPDIASNGDDVFVTFHSQPEATGFVYVVKSSDGAVTFGDTVRAESATVEQSRYPVIAVDPIGNPAVMFMKFEGNWIDPQYVVANSTDGGVTYLNDTNASELAPGEVCDCCPAALLSEGQRQVAMFRNNDENLRDLWVTVSNDNGADFDTGDDMDPNNWIINSCPSTGPDGYINEDTLYTVVMSAGQGASRIYMSSVHLPTATRGNTWEVAPNMNSSANQNYPRIAGEGEVLGIVYQEAASGNIDCYITISIDGGNAFSAPVLLHEETSGTQRNPDLTYGNGQFHVVFEDIGAGSLIYRTVELPGLGISETNALPVTLWADNGTINIKIPTGEEYDIHIINAVGQSVGSESSAKNSIAFPVKTSGVYLVTVSSNNQKTTQQLVVN